MGYTFYNQEMGKKKHLVNRPQNGVAIWIQCSEEGLNQFVTA